MNASPDRGSDRWLTNGFGPPLGAELLVLESSKSSGGARPRRLLGTMPRRTRLGPVAGRWGQVHLLGEWHWVHQRFHSQIVAADHEVGFPA